MSAAATSHPSPNFDDRGDMGVDMIVLHYTGMADGRSARDRLTDPAPTLGRYRRALPPRTMADGPDDAALPRVSAHYLVETGGQTWALVPEDRRAWHAGAAYWAGASDINARSVGIEIVNGGHDFPDGNGGLPRYPDAQIDAVIALVQAVAARHNTPPWRVVGHSDVAPDRKQDPGEHFPWARLGEAGVALAPSASLSPSQPVRVIARAGAAGDAVRRIQGRLGAFGYGVVETGGYDARTANVVTAFQRRFRPDASLFGVWTTADDTALGAAFMRAKALALKAEREGASYAIGPPADPG